MISLVTIVEAFYALLTKTVPIVLSGFWVQEKRTKPHQNKEFIFLETQGTSFNRGV